MIIVHVKNSLKMRLNSKRTTEKQHIKTQKDKNEFAKKIGRRYKPNTDNPLSEILELF